MRPTAQQLAMRDPAMAAALGILPGAGADFGNDYGYEFAGDYGNETARFAGFGGYQPEFAGEFGVEPHPSHQGGHRGGHRGMHPDHRRALERLHHLEHRTREREMLLEPNKGSSTKVERYDFSLNTVLSLGTASIIDDMSLQPAVTLRPQRLITNAPSVGFVVFQSIQVANVAITVGQATDAFTYSVTAFDSRIDAPTLSPANRATLSGTYTGFAPPPLSAGPDYIFIATFQGPATIVA